MEIRASLTLEETPAGIPGANYPSSQDRAFVAEDLAISPGDSMAVEIYELRERQQPFQGQLSVSATGSINLPVIGRIQAAGLTVPEFEEAIRVALQEKQVLLAPQVTVNPVFLNRATYSIFGIGVSAADNAPLRAGTFPIRRPDLRLLEAINLVGGLNEFVSDVYVFRTWESPEYRSGKNGAQGRTKDSHREFVAGGSRPVASSTLGAATSARDPGGVAERRTDSNRASPPIGRESGSLKEKNRTPAEELEAAVLNRDEKVEPEKDDLGTKLLEEGHGRRLAGEDQEARERDVQELERVPEAPGAYIFVNGEWVRNPAFDALDRVEDHEGQGAPTFDAPAPAVNWSRVAGESNYRVLLIPADSLRSGDTDANIYVRPGDIIRIVSGEIGVFYVMGQVNRVGAFNFNAEPVTLKSAIASAGGLSSLAWPDRCTIYRRLGQREQMIQVNLDRIFAGQDPDFLIRRGDIVNVGTHPFAPFLERIRGLTLPNPVSNVGYSFTYARNYADIDSFSVRQNPHNVPDQFPNIFP